MKCRVCGHENAEGAVYCSECSKRLRFGERYIVEEWLGAGSFGAVYRCRDKNLSRDVAIKELLPQHRGDIRVSEKFAQEAKVLAALQHPNIVRIIDYDSEDLFIVMEYVEAKDLLKAEKDEPGYCVRHFDAIVNELTCALSCAHSHNILHRDLKFENILITPTGLKISDFGLAAIVESAGAHITAAGTLPYMAPEILLHKTVHLTADLYSLGALFYHIWTHRFPFEGTDYHVARGHISEPPPDPSAINPRIPRALEQIILRLLDKEPSNRFADADEVRETYLREVVNRQEFAVTDMNEFQRRLAGIFGEINKNRTHFDLLANLQVRASGLSRFAMLPKSEHNTPSLTRFLCKCFGWAFALSTNRRVQARDAVTFKYRNLCPYCRKPTCDCPPEGKGADAWVPQGEIPDYRTFDELREMFRRIYGARNRDLVTATHKLHVELGELSEAILNANYVVDKQTENITRDEIADLFAWLFAVSNLLPPEIDVSRELFAYYDAKCPRCGEGICRCDLKPSKFELIQNVRERRNE